MAEIKSFTCPQCGRVSYNLNDILNRYCGFCHKFITHELLPYYFKDGKLGIISDAPGSDEAMKLWPDLEVKTLAEWEKE